MKFLQITARLFVVTALFGLVLGTTGCGDKKDEKKDDAKETKKEEGKDQKQAEGKEKPAENKEQKQAENKNSDEAGKTEPVSVTETKTPEAGSSTGSADIFNDDFDF